MAYYRSIGSIPPKRHTAHRREGGHKDEGLYYEEVVTTAGFGRAYSIVYHLRPPTRVKKIEAAGAVNVDIVPQATLRHIHTKSGKMPRHGDPITGRVPVFSNADVTLSTGLIRSDMRLPSTSAGYTAGYWCPGFKGPLGGWCNGASTPAPGEAFGVRNNENVTHFLGSLAGNWRIAPSSTVSRSIGRARSVLCVRALAFTNHASSWCWKSRSLANRRPGSKLVSR